MTEHDVETMRADFYGELRRLRLKQDIIYAFEQLAGQKPYKYQRDFLLDTSRLIAINKSRQTGMTRAGAFKMFWHT